MSHERRKSRRAIAVLFAAFCLAITTTAGATTPGVAPLATVPIKFERRQVRVPVSIQGSAPFMLLLDTGMPTRGVLLHHTARVDSLGLIFEEGGHLNGAGDSTAAVATRMATASRIEVGGLTIPDVPVMVLPSGTGLPQSSDGIIGAELLEKYAVRVDVDEGRLDLYDSARFVPVKESTVVPLRIRERKAFVNARVAVGSGALVPADLAIDLGAGHSLWLNEGNGKRFAPPTATIQTTLGRGLTGPIYGRVGRVRRFELGNQAFDGVVTIFPVPEHQNPGGFDFRDGFIGAELLTRFDVTFDYPRKRMILERGGRFAEPFEFDMTGMSLSQRGLDRRRVDSIVAKSPAEEAGIAAGDVLLAVDGQPLALLGPDGLSRAFRREGVEVTLTLKRDTATIEKKLRLRRLV